MKTQKTLLKKALLTGTVGFGLMGLGGDLTPKSWNAFAEDHDGKKKMKKKGKDHQCGEGKCAGKKKMKKGKDGSCGKGKCGGKKKGKEGGCGEGSCG